MMSGQTFSSLRHHQGHTPHELPSTTKKKEVEMRRKRSGFSIIDRPGQGF